MKKIILIALILLIASSLKSQTWRINPDSLYDARYVLLPWNTATDSLKYKKAGWLHPLLQKSSPRHDLKAKTAQLIPIALAMYIWRDELTEFSYKYNKISYALLSFGITRYFGWQFAVGFMAARELTQIEIFNFQAVYKDTGGDLLAGSVGMFLAIKF